MSISRFLLVTAVATLHFLTVTMADTSDSTNVSAGPRTNCEESLEDEIFDLEFLETHLRATRAVAPLTKLKLNSDIKKLLAKLEDYHMGISKYSIDQLQEQFDLLYLKVVSLVQDKDLDLHRHLCNSWGPLWRDLRDPDYFSKT